MRASQLGRFAALSLILLALSWSMDAQQSSASCQNPTVTVKPGEDLQQAIEQAPQGASLQLLAGRYYVSLIITKSLMLCGQDPTKTVLARDPVGGPPVLGGNPVVRIESEQPIQVTLKNLSIAGASARPSEWPEDNIGIHIGGQAQVWIQNVWVRNNRLVGVLIEDSAVVTLSQSQITQNGFYNTMGGGGLVVQSRSGQVTIEDSQIFENTRAGIIVGSTPNDTLHVIIRRSQIYANYEGIILGGVSGRVKPASSPVQVTIEDSDIFLNYLFAGIYISAGTEFGATPIRLEVSITNSRVSANGGYGVGILADDESQAAVELRHVTVEGNGANLSICRGAETVDGLVCDGIWVDSAEGIQVTIADTTSQWNAGWGVAVRLKKCNSYYLEETFEGQLLLEGTNVFERNNTAGYHEGEVCLP